MGKLTCCYGQVSERKGIWGGRGKGREGGMQREGKGIITAILTIGFGNTFNLIFLFNSVRVRGALGKVKTSKP